MNFHQLLKLKRENYMFSHIDAYFPAGRPINVFTIFFESMSRHTSHLSLFHLILRLFSHFRTAISFAATHPPSPFVCEQQKQEHSTHEPTNKFHSAINYVYRSKEYRWHMKCLNACKQIKLSLLRI